MTTALQVSFTTTLAELVALKGSDKVQQVCYRCSGRGNVGYGNVDHWDVNSSIGHSTGSCFDCNGRGWTSVLVSSVRARIRRNEAAQAKWAAEDAAAKLRQAEYDRKLAEKKALELAAKAALVQAGSVLAAGRQVVEGTILGFKEVESYFSYRPTITLKMIVETANGKVYGTVPTSILGSVEKGTRVRFTGTVEVSKDDVRFGFFSRPTKAEVL